MTAHRILRSVPDLPLGEASAPLIAKTDLDVAQAMLDTIDGPSCMVDSDGVVAVVNNAWVAFAYSCGADPAESATGTNYLAVCDAAAVAEPDGVAADVARGLRGVLGGAQSLYTREYPCHTPTTESWFTVRISPVEVGGQRGAVVTHVNATHLHVAEAAVAFQRSHDLLTGLPNRDGLTLRVQEHGDRAGASDGPTVCIVGLDGFKRVNNGLGPHRGDDVLVAAARRLGERVQPYDLLARFASDEFGVVFAETLSDEQAAARAEDLIEAIREPFDIDGAIVALTASAGVATRTAADLPAEVLMKATVAMREAKRRGGDRVREYSDTIADTYARRLAIESELRSALQQSELDLYYQPIVDITTGVPAKVEALLRWNSPTRGVVSPDEFIPIAESTGLILPLGRWVLSRACHDAAAFTGAAEQLAVTVNISARQLTDPALVDYVRTALSTSGLAPERLYLEVTEWSLMQDEDMAEAALRDLTQLGVRVAIDDFGTGYSSLLYLRRYPVAVLKLDRAFVSGIGFSPDDEAICRGVIGLATWMQLGSVAEGVETAEQAAELASFGCEFGQGYLWSPAVPVADLPRALAACTAVRLEDVRPSDVVNS